MPPSEKIQESSPDAYLSKSEKPILPVTGTDTVQPPDEGSFDLSSDGKPTMIKGDQANTKSNVSLSASQAVGQSENRAVKELPSEDLVSPFSRKNLERRSPEEQSKQQQQTGQSSNRSSKDDSTEANGTTTGDIQPSPVKQSMHAAKGSRNQQQADQDVFQSRQGNRKRIEETATDDLRETNEASQRAASEQQQGENVPRVQWQSDGTNNSYKPTKDALGNIQADSKSESSLRTPKEPKKQAQTEGKTRGGETNAPASETETSDKVEDQISSSAARNRDTGSRKSDGSTDGTKSADTDDKNPPLL